MSHKNESLPHFILHYKRFALSLHKTGGTSVEHSSKLDVLLSVCTIFAKRQCLLTIKLLYINKV